MKKGHIRLAGCVIAVAILLTSMLAFPSASAGEFPFSEYAALGVDGAFKTYNGKLLYGIYNTNRTSWRLNDDFYDPMGYNMLIPPPGDAVCLITVYDGDELKGFREVSGDSFYVTLPPRLMGIESFDERFSQYKPFGFDRYAYDGKNVRGFFDDVSGALLLTLDPETGGLLTGRDEDTDGHVHLVAEYAQDALTGVKVVAEEEFSSTDGVKEAVQAIQEEYFQAD